MLEKVPTPSTGSYMDFGSIARYSTGTGRCFVYNAVMKPTKAGKPFITLYLRDVQGNSIPGYVFDLRSPLMAGGQANHVVNKIVEIDWQENYLGSLGLTLILDRVAVIEDATADDHAKFKGSIEDGSAKMDYLKNLVKESLGKVVSFPMLIETATSVDYLQGRVGGLAEHYWRMAKMLEQVEGIYKIERKNLMATFLLYVLVHSNYVRAKDQGADNITLVTNLTEKVSGLATTLKLSSGALEIVHMFFGYEPKDIYVRTVAAVSEYVKRFDHEFSLYRTVPLEQEGNAGYGTIRRYFVEEQE